MIKICRLKVIYVFAPAAAILQSISPAFRASTKFAQNATQKCAEVSPNKRDTIKLKSVKIAITSTGNSLQSLLDQRFGRCAWMVYYDTETGATEFVPNPHKNIEEKAGELSVGLLASRKPDIIISGEFGEKAKDLLDSMKIQLILIKQAEITIEKIIERISRNHPLKQS